MTESLYLVIERAKRSWRGTRVARISKKRPTLARPSEQAIIKLRVEIPDNIMEPREVNVRIEREHIALPNITATSQPAL